MAVVIPNTFVNGTSADAESMNANFNSVVAWLNKNPSLADATVAFTGLPATVAADPTLDVHLARKQYVDLTGCGQSKYGATTSGGTLTGTPVTVVTFDIAIPAFVTTMTYLVTAHVEFSCTNLNGISSFNLLTDVTCEGVSLSPFPANVDINEDPVTGTGVRSFNLSTVVAKARGDGTHTFALKLSTASGVAVGAYNSETSLTVRSFYRDLTVL